jgi:hypothetical protein
MDTHTRSLPTLQSSLDFFSGLRKKKTVNMNTSKQASRDKKFCDGNEKVKILGYIRDRKPGS